MSAIASVSHIRLGVKWHTWATPIAGFVVGLIHLVAGIITGEDILLPFAVMILCIAWLADIFTLKTSQDTIKMMYSSGTTIKTALTKLYDIHTHTKQGKELTDKEKGDMRVIDSIVGVCKDPEKAMQDMLREMERGE